jgi:hypothetical protein
VESTSRPGLRSAQILNLVQAERFADAIQTPLNIYVVVRLRDAPDTPQHALGEFLEKLGKALENRHVERRWIWTIEVGGYVGLHLNLLAFLPDAHRADLLALLETQVAAALGARTLPADTLHWRAVVERDNVLRYICKTCSGSAHRLLLRLTPDATRSWPPSKDQHRIDGKRAGVSESLGVTARSRFNPANR